MDCSGFRARHVDYLDGTLDERDAVACARHRAACAACAALDARVRRALLLCHNVADPLPSCDLTARIMAGVQADQQAQRRRRDALRTVRAWVVAAAATP